MSKETAGTLAKKLGFEPLPSQPGSYFKTETSYAERKPVGLLLHIARARQPGTFHWALATDGGATTVRGIGAAAEIERGIFVALVKHEAHELRKEAG